MLPFFYFHACLQVRLAHVVRDVGSDAAARWWADFQDGRSDHPYIPGHRRRILARAPDSVVMEEETKLLGLRVFTERTTAWPDGREVRFAGRSNFALFDGSYSFEEHPRGTRIVLDANVSLARPLGWADLVARPIVAAILRADLAGHAKDMRSDLIGRRQNARWRRA